jgi:hypothetical protein
VRRGVSISAYTDEDRKDQDTTRFSGVECQLEPTRMKTEKIKTPPALAAWSVNFSLTAVTISHELRAEFEKAEERLKLKLHAALAGGVSRSSPH